jgi:hypothetical protein
VPDPPPGDFNLDFRVDTADLTIWRQNFPNFSGSATVAMGDADGNGLVDGADFLAWQRHVTGPPQMGAFPTPEPGGGATAFLFACFAPWLRPKRR